MIDNRLRRGSELYASLKPRISFLWGVCFSALVVMPVLFWGSPAKALSPETFGPSLIRDLGQTILSSLAAEASNLEEIQARLRQAERERLYLSAATNGYRVKLSSHGNLLLSPEVDIPALQKARSDTKETLIEIQKMIDEIRSRLSSLEPEKTHLGQQILLIEKQLGELEMVKSSDKSIPRLKADAGNLLKLLKRREKTMDQLRALHGTRLENMTQLHTSFSELGNQIDAFIEKRKKQDLFERRKDFFRPGGVMPIMEDLGQVREKIREAARPGFWAELFQKLWESAGLILVSLIIVSGVILFGLTRIQRLSGSARSHPLAENLGRWHWMLINIVHRSLRLAGITLLVSFYSHLDSLYPIQPVLDLLKNFLYVWLISRWLLLAVTFWPRDPDFPEARTKPLPKLIRTIRYFAGFYLLVQFALTRDSSLLIFLRLIFSLYLFLWSSFVWKDVMRSSFRPSGETAGPGKLFLRMGCRYFFPALGGIPLLLDMIGYGSLAAHWYLSWGKSAAVLLWWTLFLLLLQEWDHYYKEKSKARKNELLYNDYPVQWVAIRFGQLVWLISLIILLLLAWGSRQAVLGNIYTLLGQPLQVGNMSFSVLGILYAVLVLLITYAIVRLWKWIFQAKFLNRSGMEMGLQDSITTISLYVIWMFGILVALHVFGLNSASLAVAFGALGIGLGFGLQNIFSNFVSGIILLFERPIQIGDDLEINGTWATVKKINFRSTVVQTYDNASLIIPNSQFISSEVTNWSFKDKRLRRNITVGVAYGSDVTLVRDTLLEIARTTPRILSSPRPDVLFKDFGDSALIFTLRVWTDIDNMLKVETAVRFEIDRLFRERNIEISFPQRDIHIRSMPEKRIFPVPEPVATAGDNH